MGADLGVAAGLLVLLAVATEGGHRLGRRAAAAIGAAAGGSVGAIQGVMLGLLGLFLGFSFAGAAGRFLERQDLIVQEANAIGTAYLRADLIDEPQRAELRASLAQYVERRLAVSATLHAGIKDEARAEIGRMHERIWKAASSGALARPEVMLLVIPPVNEVIDLHSTRLAAGRKHLPMPVMTLLVMCSALSMGVIGYGSGLVGRRSVMLTASLVILITTALWTTLDLDYPRAGFIRLNDAPLKELNLSPAG